MVFFAKGFKPSFHPPLIKHTNLTVWRRRKNVGLGPRERDWKRRKGKERKEGESPVRNSQWDEKRKRKLFRFVYSCMDSFQSMHFLNE